MPKKTAKAKAPDQLARTGKTSGVELKESDLGQVRGGAAVKIGPTYK